MNAYVVMSDEASSAVGAVALSGGITNFFGVDLGRDPQLSLSGGRVFYVARDLDTIFELSPRCGEPICRWSTRRSQSSGPASLGTSNPQDVAVAPDGFLWVPRYAAPEIAIFDASGRETETLKLPDLDGDGNPDASAIRIVDVAGRAKAFVALELLDDTKLPPPSRKASALLEYDVATRTLETTIPLRGRNPFNAMVERGTRFFLAEPGNFDDAGETDAGVERIDYAAPDRDRLLIPEIELGGSVSAVAIDDGCGAAIIADPSEANLTSVVTFDPETGETFRTPKKGGALYGPSAGFDLWAIAWSEGRLLIGDRRRQAKGYPIVVFERTGSSPCQLTLRSEPIYVAQKPVALRAIP